ncbi:hypothetical protein G6F60_014280 [Rhizopus arrhizus]|nr:hypothetical protein G6F60_014280 [Rhizopus arrhizus]
MGAGGPRQRRAGVKLGPRHADDRAGTHQHVAPVDHEVQRNAAAGGAGQVIHGAVARQIVHAGGRQSAGPPATNPARRPPATRNPRPRAPYPPGGRLRPGAGRCRDSA